MKGYLALVLHAHLPFVRHPEYSDFLEEDWLYEAITETYIPLINIYDNLLLDNIDFRVTMSISPPLCAMLSDQLLMDRYSCYLDKRLELSEKELIRTKSLPIQHETAKMYNQKFKLFKDIFENRYKKNLLDAFRKFQDLGKMEIITCAATHGFLPLISNDESINAQIKIAVEEYRRFFGNNPRGIWLPECAYKKGIDTILRNNGIKYFFTDTHGITLALPKAKNNVYAPIVCPDSNVLAFARDIETAKQVWSKDAGYPGNCNYREFYKDIGYDADYEYIKPYLHADGERRNVGLKYYKVTGPCDLSKKEEYNPDNAILVAEEHAKDFIKSRKKQVKKLINKLGVKPIIVANYDAELFGHWWYEGPEFLNFLFREMRGMRDVFELITPSQYLAKAKAKAKSKSKAKEKEKEKETKFETLQPATSSWGACGYYDVWLTGRNDWIYRHLHKCEEFMVELAKKYKNVDNLLDRALNQCARELLLAQASDWAFIMTTGTVVEYAVRRTKDHISRFMKLYNFIEYGDIDEAVLNEYEKRDNIFPYIDYRVYASR